MIIARGQITLTVVEDGRSLIPLYIRSDTKPTIPVGRVSTLPTGWSRILSEASYSKLMYSVDGDWKKALMTITPEYSIGGVIPQYSLRKMRIRMYSPTSTSFEVKVSKNNYYGAVYLGYLSEDLEVNASEIDFAEHTKADNGTSTYTYDLPAGESYIDIWYYRGSVDNSLNNSIKVGFPDLSHTADLDSAVVWVSPTLYDEVVGDYELTEPYVTVEPPTSTPLDETFKSGSVTMKGAAVIAGALVVTKTNDTESATDEDIVGVVKGALGDDIFIVAHESDAYNTAVDFIQGNFLSVPNTLVTQRGDLYVHNIVAGNPRYTNTTISQFGITCNDGVVNNTMIGSSVLSMPNITKDEWLSYDYITPAIDRTEAIISNSTSTEDLVEVISDEIELPVPCYIGFNIWAQGDIRRYIVQRKIDSEWIDLVCNYLDIRPNEIGAGIGILVMDGTYRVKIQAQSYGVASSIAPKAKIYLQQGKSLLALPSQGTFMYGNGWVSVTGSLDKRMVKGIRNGEYFDYRQNDPDKIIYHPNGWVEQWGTEIINNNIQYVMLEVAYPSEDFNIQVTVDNFTGEIVQSQALTYFGTGDRFSIKSSATGHKVHWRAMGKLQTTLQTAPGLQL